MKIKVFLCIVTVVFSLEAFPNNFISDHCERITLNQVDVQRRGGRSGHYYLTDGKGEIASFALRKSAFFALRTLNDFDLSLFCHLDPKERLFPYFLTAKGHAPIGREGSGETCFSLDENLSVQAVRRLFKTSYKLNALTSSGRIEVSEFDREEDALAAKQLVEQLGFRVLCREDNARNGFQYFRGSNH